MIRSRHILHPVRSARSFYRKAQRYAYKCLAERQFRNIRRGQRDRCWCGGNLLPFKWHSSYGVCANCACYVNRRPPINLQELYSSRLYWHIMQKYYGYPAIESRGELYKRDGRLDYWLQLVRRYGPSQGRVIEIGCPPGILLLELQALGYDCIGVEPDAKTVDWIQQNMKVNVRAGFFPGVELPNCELFLAFDVIEHSPNPDQFMREVARLLNPGGIAIIQTPVNRYSYDPPFVEKFKSAFKEFEHLFLFTNKSMEMLAELSDLEVVTLDVRLWLHHEICVFRKPQS